MDIIEKSKSFLFNKIDEITKFEMVNISEITNRGLYYLAETAYKQSLTMSDEEILARMKALYNFQLQENKNKIEELKKRKKEFIEIYNRISQWNPNLEDDIKLKKETLEVISNLIPTEDQIEKLEKEMNIPFDSSNKAIREHKEKLLNDKEKYFALWQKDVETLNFIKEWRYRIDDNIK